MLSYLLALLITLTQALWDLFEKPQSSIAAKVPPGQQKLKIRHFLAKNQKKCLCFLHNIMRYFIIFVFKVQTPYSTHQVLELGVGDVPGVCGGGAGLPGWHVLQHLPLDAGG